MRLRKNFSVLEADLRPLILLGSLHLVVAASHTLTDIAATSLLIAHLGADVLPQVYVGGALLLILTGLFVMPLIDRLDRMKLFSGTLLCFAALLSLAYPARSLAPDVVYRAVYLLCFLMKSLVFLEFWLIAGDVCDLRQAKRVFPPLLGFSLAGGLSASAVASVLPGIAPEELLILAALLLLVGLVPTRLVGRHYRGQLRRPALPARLRSQGNLGRLRSDLGMSVGSPLLRNLALSVLIFSVLAQILDFLMGKAASLRFVDASGAVDPEALTSFYAVLNGGVIGAGALVQFVVARRLLSSIGVTRGQLTAPFALLAGFGAIAAAVLLGGATAFFFAVLGSRVVQKVLRVSLYRSSTDLVLNPIPADRRGRAKAFKETLIEPAGVLLGGVLLLAAGILDVLVLVLGSLALSAVFLYLTYRLKAQYLAALVHFLRERSRFRYAFPSVTMRKIEPESPREKAFSDLERALTNEEVSVRLLAVEVAAELREPAAAPLLIRRFGQETDPRVRATMVAALGKLLKRRSDSLEAIEPALEDEDPRVRANGIEALAQLGLSQASPLVEPFAADPEPRIRANAAWGLGRLDPIGGLEKGREILAEMLGSRNEPARLSALYALGEIGDERSAALLESALEEQSPSIRRRALLSLAQTGRRQSIGRLIELLEAGDGATRHLAARALSSCGEAAIEPLILALWGSGVEVRRYVVEALSRIGSQRAQQAMIHILSLEAEEAYYDLLRLQKISELPQTAGVKLLAESLAQRVGQAKRNALQVLHAVFGQRSGMRLILSNLVHPDPFVRASAIEALEIRIAPSLLGGILPLFEHSNPKIAAEHGGSLYELPSRGSLQVVLELAGDRSGWLRACALYALGELGSPESVPVLERRVSDPYELARLNAIEALGRFARPSSRSLLEVVARESSGKVRAYAEEALARIGVEGSIA